MTELVMAKRKKARRPKFRAEDRKWERAYKNTVERAVAETGLQRAAVMRVVDIAFANIPRRGGRKQSPLIPSVLDRMRALKAQGMRVGQVVEQVLNENEGARLKGRPSERTLHRRYIPLVYERVRR